MRWRRRSSEFLRPLPQLAYLVLLIIWLGIGETSKITLLFLAALPVSAVAARDGVRNVSQARVRVAQSLGASEWQIFRHVVFPSALAEICTGRAAGGRHRLWHFDRQRDHRRNQRHRLDDSRRRTVPAFGLRLRRHFHHWLHGYRARPASARGRGAVGALGRQIMKGNHVTKILTTRRRLLQGAGSAPPPWPRPRSCAQRRPRRISLSSCRPAHS